jgi:ABC-type uncharacterized transport system auxiliary subunit
MSAKDRENNMRFAIAMGIVLFLLSGCSVTKTVPSKMEYRLLGPKMEPLERSACQHITIKLEPIQSPEILLDKRMYYVLDDIQQHFYTQSLWSQSPNRRIETVIKDALIQSNMFASVLDYRSNAETQWRYEVRLLDAMQYFKTDKESYVRLSMDFVLIKNVGREVVSSKHFELELPSKTLDAKGGVLALTQALQEIIRKSHAWLEYECQQTP